MLLLAVLNTALAAPKYPLGPDDPRIYVAGRLPITAVGGRGRTLDYALLDLAPVSFEYRLTGRWNLRLQPSVGYELDLAGGGGIYSENLQVSMPAYFGDRALAMGMVGYYAGPFVTGGLTRTALQGSAGVIGGVAGPLSRAARYRAGAWLGLAAQPATWTLSFDYGGVLEFGALF